MRLLAAGHRRIGVLSGDLSSFIYREMLAGFRGALAEEEIYPEAGMVIKNPLQARRFGFPDNADAAPGNHAQNPLLLKHPQSNAYSSAPHFQFFRQTALRRQEFRMVVTAGQNPAAESCNDFPVQWSGHLFVVPFQIW